VFVRCGSVCLSVCVQLTGQSDQFKTVKGTDFKYDVHVLGTVRTWPLKIFQKGPSVEIHLATALSSFSLC